MVRRTPARPGMAVVTIPRRQFISDVWVYRQGEHVSFIGPTNSGKTYLAQALLAVSVTPEMPGYMTVMKPKDKTVSQFLERHGWRRSVTYPIPPSVHKKPPGWAVWPIHTDDPESDDERHEGIFRRLHRDRYVKGDCIIFDDEVVSLVREMDMGKDLRRIWTKGRSVGIGLWAATQRPAFVPLEMYDQAEHVFLAFDPDARSRKRFEEIGGVDPDLIGEIVAKLPKWHWLYIRRSDRVMAVIGP